MENSSTTTRSVSSGCFLPRLNPPDGNTSNSRWIVCAAQPVDSPIRLAARPVGAQSRNRTFLAARIFNKLSSNVVLPTPGPPVTTTNRTPSTVRRASI